MSKRGKHDFAGDHPYFQDYNPKEHEMLVFKKIIMSQQIWGIADEKVELCD